MPRVQKPLTEKEFVRPGRHGARMVGGPGIDPAANPPPAYWSEEHQALWIRQITMFAPSLRPVDLVTFRMYMDALIEYDEITQAIYLAKAAAKALTNAEEIVETLEAVARGQKAADSAFGKLLKAQDKLCANPYNAARVPELKTKEKGLADMVGDMFK